MTHYTWEHPTHPTRVARPEDASFATDDPQWVRGYPVEVWAGAGRGEREAFDAWFADRDRAEYPVRYHSFTAGWQARAALASQTPGEGWMPIESAPKEGKEMFVVRAFGVCNGMTRLPYDSDAYAVWRDSNSTFARWPHAFEPTHWLPLPPKPPATPGEAHV